MNTRKGNSKTPRLINFLLAASAILSLVLFAYLPPLWGGDSGGYTNNICNIKSWWIYGAVDWDAGRTPIYITFLSIIRRIFYQFFNVSPCPANVGLPIAWQNNISNIVGYLQLFFALMSTGILVNLILKRTNHRFVQVCYGIAGIILVLIPSHVAFARYILPESLSYTVTCCACIVFLLITKELEIASQLGDLRFSRISIFILLQNLFFFLGAFLKPQLIAPLGVLVAFSTVGAIYAFCKVFPSANQAKFNRKKLILSVFSIALILANLSLLGNYYKAVSARVHFSTFTPVSSIARAALVYKHEHLLSKKYTSIQKLLTSSSHITSSRGTYYWIPFNTRVKQLEAIRLHGNANQLNQSEFLRLNKMGSLYYAADEFSSAVSQVVQKHFLRIYADVFISESKKLFEQPNMSDHFIAAYKQTGDPIILVQNWTLDSKGYLKPSSLYVYDSFFTTIAALSIFVVLLFVLFFLIFFISNFSMLLTSDFRLRTFELTALSFSLLAYYILVLSVGWYEARYNYYIYPLLFVIGSILIKEGQPILFKSCSMLKSFSINLIQQKK